MRFARIAEGGTAPASGRVHRAGDVDDRPVADARGDRGHTCVRGLSRVSSKRYIWVSELLATPEHYALAARRLLGRLEAARRHVTPRSRCRQAWCCGRSRILRRSTMRSWRESQRVAVRSAFWILDAVRHFGAEHGMQRGATSPWSTARRWRGGVRHRRRRSARPGGVVRRCLSAYARDSGLRLTCHAGETGGPGIGLGRACDRRRAHRPRHRVGAAIRR